MTKLRIVSATVLISASLVCVAFALSKGQRAAQDKCNASLQYCYDATCRGYSGSTLNRCQAFCESNYLRCMHTAGIPGYLSAPLFTPTPRPGPTAPPNKSNPTPTPRTGPDGVSSLPKSHPLPTPSPSGPTLLDKQTKSAPTPTPNHYHGNSPTPTPSRTKRHQ